MPKPIKIREVEKNIKTLDKKRVLTDGIRTVYAKTREIAEQGTGNHQLQRHGDGYAQDKTELGATESALQLENGVRVVPLGCLKN
ncbi:MAG: hypothetical protein FWG23_00835 [Eggerthellaceae bacterium]|nr:hypothetical protein [Eggerthellaceae bacterium]